MKRLKLDIQRFATNGRLQTPANEDGSYFYLRWNRTSVNVENNTSTIWWQIGVHAGTNYYSNAVSTGQTIIDGQVVHGGGTYSNISAGDRGIAEGYLTLTHNSDGTRTFSASISGWTWQCSWVSANNANNPFVLNTIQRTSVINEITCIDSQLRTNNIEGTFKVQYTRYNVNYTDDLVIKYLERSSNTWKSLKTISNYVTNTEFTFTQQELNTVYNSDEKQTLINLKFNMRTYNGQTLLGNGAEKTMSFKIYDNLPVFTDFDFEDTNATTLALTGNDQINVNGYSNIKITIADAYKATGQKGATISKYKIIVGDQTIEINSNDIYKCSKAGELLCTLDGRTYTKTTDDPCFVAYFYISDGYTGPMLVGETADSVKFTTEGQTLNGTQITYRGGTYYVGSTGYYMAGNKTSTGGKAVKLSDSSMTPQQAYEFLLDKMIDDDDDIVTTINNSTTGTYQIYAIDSRNNSTLVTKFASSEKKYTPLVRNTNYSVERDDGGVGRNVTLTFSGIIWNDSFGAVTNGFDTAKYLFKKTDSSVWIDLADLGITPTNITPTISGNTFSFSGLIRSNNNDTTWDLDSSYDIKVILEDKLSSVEFETVLASAIPNISLSKNGVGIMCDYDETLGGALQVDGKIIDGLEHCLTTEHRIGTWIDGKPLYSKWYKTTITSQTQNLVSITLSNYGVIWVNKYFSKNTQNSIIGPYYYNSTDFQRIWIEGGHTVMFQGGSAFPSRPAPLWFELRYTKASD